MRTHVYVVAMTVTKLRQWLESTGTTQVALSERTGIPQTLLTKYVNGHVTPGIQNASLIARATKGGVPLEAWVKPVPSQQPKKRVA